jgi:hypothetical protein
VPDDFSVEFPGNRANQYGDVYPASRFRRFLQHPYPFDHGFAVAFLKSELNVDLIDMSSPEPIV